jgi:hypothetical protein
VSENLETGFVRLSSSGFNLAEEWDRFYLLALLLNCSILKLNSSIHRASSTNGLFDGQYLIFYLSAFVECDRMVVFLRRRLGGFRQFPLNSVPGFERV